MTRAALLAYIDNNVYPNANNEITALMVRDVLHRMVDFLGDAATYGVGDVALNDGGLVTGGAVQSAINTTLSSAIMFQGVTTTPLTDGSTNPNITIDGESYTAHRGDEVIYGGKEFLWTGTKWQQLGDEESWAAKTITISAGTGLTGGGNLTQNRTISLSQDSLEKLTAAGTIASYFSGGKLKYANLPDLYLARTKVKSAAAQDTLLGVAAISNAAASDASDKSRIEWDADNDAWHFYGNIYTDGWWSGRGVSPGAGGGGGGIDPAAMWSLLAAPTTEPINSTHISFPVTSVAGYTGAVSAAQIAAALGLGSLAYQSALTSAQVTNALGYTPQTEISDLSTIRSNASAGATIAGYFTNGKLGASHLPDLYLARTSVSETPANKTIYGVDGISHAAAADNTDKSRIVWDADNDAWHFYGNIYTDGWWSGRGVSPGSGGGGGGIDPTAMWSLLGAPTSEPINSTHISFPVTSVAGHTGAVSAAQIAAALGLGSLAYQSALTSAQVTNALGYTPVNPTSLGSFAYKNSLSVSDIPDLSGTYLPLSGGTITNWNRDSLVLRTGSGDTQIPYIMFRDGTYSRYCYVGGFYESGAGYFAWLGCGSARLFLDSTGNSVRVGTDATNYIVYHAGNFVAGTNYVAPSAISDMATQTWVGNHYLPLSGGVLTNTNRELIRFVSNDSNQYGPYVSFYTGNSRKGYVGYISDSYNEGMFIQAGSNVLYVDQTVGSLHVGLETSPYVVYTALNANKSGVPWSAQSLTIGIRNHTIAEGANTHLNITAASGYNLSLSAQATIFYYGANRVEGIRLNGAGNVGIGTPSPSEKVDINGNLRACGVYSSGGVTHRLVNYSDNPWGLLFRTEGTYGGWSIQNQRESTTSECFPILFQPYGGNVGIGLPQGSNPLYKLDVAGDIHASTGIWTDGYFSGRGLAQTSDERDKGGWRNVTFTLADIVNAPAGSFAWLNAPGRSAGTTAQYWQKFTPELVGTKPDGKLSLEYGPLAFLIAHKTAEELYETNTKVDKQGEELRRVKEELGAAKIEINNLRARLGIAS